MGLGGVALPDSVDAAHGSQVPPPSAVSSRPSHPPSRLPRSLPRKIQPRASGGGGVAAAAAAASRGGQQGAGVCVCAQARVLLRLLALEHHAPVLEREEVPPPVPGLVCVCRPILCGGGR